MTMSHGAGHVFRSIYEATAFGTRHILEDLADHGMSIGRLLAGGGGARSRLWVQIHADVLGLPIHLPADSEACALGSALMAAVHAGHYGGADEAAARMIRLAGFIEPRRDNARIYDYYYRKYLATYDALKPLMHEMAERPAGF
jgi:sugar (pentulose or hexulose) kinase